METIDMLHSRPAHPGSRSISIVSALAYKFFRMTPEPILAGIC
jgi:hypothetical protein